MFPSPSKVLRGSNQSLSCCDLSHFLLLITWLWCSWHPLTVFLPRWFLGRWEPVTVGLKKTYGQSCFLFRPRVSHNPHIQRETLIWRNSFTFGVNENFVPDWSLTPCVIQFMGPWFVSQCVNRIEREIDFWHILLEVSLQRYSHVN